MRGIQVEEYFDTEASYQINEMVKVWPKEHELIIITTKLMDVFYKNYDEVQKQKDLEYEKKYNIKLIRLDIHFKVGSRVFYKGLKNKIKELNPDILFMHGIGDFKDLLFLYGSNNYLTFRDCHMSWVASKSKYAKLYYKFFSFFFANIINKRNKYEIIYALGNEEKEYLKALGISEEMIEMLPHGYNKDIYYKDKELRKEIRKKFKVSNEEILITYIGKFDRNKEPHINLEIFNKLEKNYVENNNLKFLFLGPKSEEYMNNIFNKTLEVFKYKERILILPGKKAEELIGDYNASDICIWPRETTLSSIHAQVCGARIIMENHESNKERVVEQEYLYEINNLDNAKNKLMDLIKEIKSENKEINLSPLLEREYHILIAKLITRWEKLLEERKR